MRVNSAIAGTSLFAVGYKNNKEKKKVKFRRYFFPLLYKTQSKRPVLGHTKPVLVVGV